MNFVLNYNHPSLDVSCHHFLDETCMVQLASNVGCFLSSVSGFLPYIIQVLSSGAAIKLIIMNKCVHIKQIRLSTILDNF